jgi:DNA-binding PadR family transcriptional regulator
MGKNESRNADELLPLKPVWFHVLLALGDGPRHGYAIGLTVEELTGGALRMWPATLHGAIHQLAKQGLVAPWTAAESADGDDARRRYYELTPFGVRVLAAETARLRGLVLAAERTDALGRA